MMRPAGDEKALARNFPVCRAVVRNLHQLLHTHIGARFGDKETSDMKSILKRQALCMMAVLFAAVLAAPAAQAQSSVLETMVQLHSEPDEYYFFEDDRKQVLDYKTEQEVRICAGESRHLVPLKVTYDEQTTTLGSNDCIRVEAKTVYLEPQKRLDPNWVITAEVETM